MNSMYSTISKYILTYWLDIVNNLKLRILEEKGLLKRKVLNKAETIIILPKPVFITPCSFAVAYKLTKQTNLSKYEDNIKRWKHFRLLPTSLGYKEKKQCLIYIKKGNVFIS